ILNRIKLSNKKDAGITVHPALPGPLVASGVVVVVVSVVVVVVVVVVAVDVGESSPPSRAEPIRGSAWRDVASCCVCVVGVCVGRWSARRRRRRRAQVGDELANSMSLFFAYPTPMM